MNISGIATRMQSTSPDDWGAILAETPMDPSQLLDLERELVVTAQITAQAQNYVRHRGACTGFDQGHERALSRSAELLQSVRRVLGFNSP